MWRTLSGLNLGIRSRTEEPALCVSWRTSAARNALVVTYQGINRRRSYTARDLLMRKVMLLGE